jgi:predicted transposase YbfD/YdcC
LASSSLISAAVGRLERLPAGERARLAGVPGLASQLALVPDPRRPRGTRHGLTSLLLAAVAAVLAGARSFTAIAEWLADAPPHVLAVLGVRHDPLAGVFHPPGEATIRRVLEAVDAAALEKAIGSWLAEQGTHGGGGRRALAVDGKALRGTRHASADGQAVHLLAVADQATSAVLGQVSVDGKTNEITQFKPLLEDMDLTGAVVTADALHTQREHAEFLVAEKNAHYILIVKDNQPGLRAQIKRLPWRQVPAGHTQAGRGHGRGERRVLKVTSVDGGLNFPHAAQAIQIRRRRRRLGHDGWSTKTVYAITSLAAHQATPGQLATWIRGHWRIEALHHIRDVTYLEDHSQVRTGNGPHVMATLRNAAISILKLTGHASIAAACRHHARDATRPMITLGLSPPLKPWTPTSERLHEGFQSVNAADDMTEVILRFTWYLRVGLAFRVGFCPAHPPLDPPEGGA